MQVLFGCLSKTLENMSYDPYLPRYSTIMINETLQLAVQNIGYEKPVI